MSPKGAGCARQRRQGDSDLYDAMGYIRKSARKTGLTRKGNSGPDAVKK
jgi:hypothetical protein